MRALAVSSVLVLFLAASAPASAQLRTVDAFPGVSFDAPVEIATAPGQDERIYVVEQGTSGRARVLTIADGLPRHRRPRDGRR